MAVGFEEREDKGADRVVGFAWVGTILSPSLDMKGTFGARYKGRAGRGSVIMLGWNCETGMMEKLIDRNGTASRISNVGSSLRDFAG